MKRKKLGLALAALVAFTHAWCGSAQEVPGADAAPGIIFRGAGAIMKSNPDVRFAVLDFTDGSGSFTAYGKVIGDETFYRLQALEGIRLLERQKLGAILEENRLEMAGLVAGSGRERLGLVLPADVLVMGSYLFEGDLVRVNGRFTDVRTGEIRGTFAYCLGLVRDTARDAEKAREEQVSCEPYEKIMEPLMRDLRTPANVEAAVQAAVKIPYSMKCRAIHQHIMATFARGGNYPPDYVRFLRDTVISIPDPDERERRNAIFNYFQSDQLIDELEWNAGVLSMKNATERTISRLVYYVLNRGRDQDGAVLLKRVDILMGLAAMGAVGKPVPLAPEGMLRAIIHAGPANETTRDIRLYLLEKYAPRLSKDKKTLSFIMSYSEDSITAEKDPATRAKFYHHIAGILSSVDPGDYGDLVYQVLTFTYGIHGRHEAEDAAELRAFSTALAPWFCYAVTQTRKDYRLKSAIRILEKYDLRCPPP